MRIDHLIYLLHKRGSETFRDPKAIREMQAEVAVQGASFEDVVHLSLGHDGVWAVGAVSAPAPSTSGMSSDTSASGLPHDFRLYHSLASLYSAAGIAGALGNMPRGLFVEVYV